MGDNFEKRLDAALDTLPIKDAQKKSIRDKLNNKTAHAVAESNPAFFEFRKNLEDIVQCFNHESVLDKKTRERIPAITFERYLEAACRQPQLLYQSPNSIESNIRDLVALFSEEKLTVGRYLQAALEQPSLFCLLPKTVKGNISRVVERFRDEQLTTAQYLKAALRKPQLFYSDPDNVKSNIQDLVKSFSNDGLTQTQYLTAALKHPQLFYQDPETIAGHINLMITMYHEGHLGIHRQLTGDPYPLAPLFDYLVDNPSILSLANENFMLRKFATPLNGQDFPPIVRTPA